MGDEPIIVYHNPRCSKSRRAVAILAEKGALFTTREYLREPPDVATLRRLMECLGIDDPRRMMRTKEAGYDTAGLHGADTERLLAAMAADPILIERPIVVRGDRAIIARPPELVAEFLA